MGGVAQEVGGACFVEGPSVLGFVHCVRLQNFCFSSFCADFLGGRRQKTVYRHGSAPQRSTHEYTLTFEPLSRR